MALLLGDYSPSFSAFPEIETLFKEFSSPQFSSLHEQYKFNFISSRLYELLKKAPQGGFYFPAVIGYIEAVRSQFLKEYTFTAFEFWLNEISGISYEENLLIRSQIVGKKIPRDAYQTYFPIGMGKQFTGSHFVLAHTSPDLDTTVASFWGFMDAFGAKVTEGLHLWNVPGGVPSHLVEVGLLFGNVFGEGIYSAVAKTRSTLTLSALDLVTHHGMLKKELSEPALSFDHERQESAVVLVNEEGFYLGDWRSIDVEGVRQVIMLLSACLRWFESYFHITLISLFAKTTVTQSEIEKTIEGLLTKCLSECEPALQYTMREKWYLQSFLENVLGTIGLDATFASFAETMEKKGIGSFSSFRNALEKLVASELFDEKELLSGNRSALFEALAKMTKTLSEMLKNIRHSMESLESALNIKEKVLGNYPHYVTHRSDIDEIRTKIRGYSYITVNYASETDELIPAGVVYGSTLQKNILATVSLRDFCNREEVKIPSYFEVISVVDHHKATLTTSSAVTAHISDAQSSNAALAELAFAVNDVYSTGGMNEAEIDEQLQTLFREKATPVTLRLQKRLLKRKMALHKNANGYRISKEREFLEYLQFLYAILDDTDLLSKVSKRDLFCVMQLLNRLKSLSLNKEVEIVDFDSIENDKEFLKKGAEKLLKNRDFYSLYAKVYASKEESVEKNIEKALAGDYAAFFSDAKVLSGCTRVSQTKLFEANFAAFVRAKEKLFGIWTAKAKTITSSNEDIDMHMHMISTIASAEQVYEGNVPTYTHKDELWIYVAENERAVEHLSYFLSGFKSIFETKQEGLSLTFYGARSKELSGYFTENFLEVPSEIQSAAGESFIVFSFPPTVLNSRKTKIAPFLPVQSNK